MARTNVDGIDASSVLHVVPHHANLHFLYLSSGFVVHFDPQNGKVMRTVGLPTDDQIWAARYDATPEGPS